MREQIIKSWDKIEPDQAMQERLLNDILVSARAVRRPSKAGVGLRFSLKTLLIAVAIVMLSAATAFAAYGAGLNGQIAELQNQIDELQGQANLPTDVKELQEIIVSLQDQNDTLIEQANAVLEQNEALQEQVTALNEEIEVLRGLVITTVELPNGKKISLTMWEESISAFAREVGIESTRFATLAEAAAYAKVSFKEPQWLPAGAEPKLQQAAGNLLPEGYITFFRLNNGLYPDALVYYRVPAQGPESVAYDIIWDQYYFGPDYTIYIDVAEDIETYMVNGVEVVVVPTDKGYDLYWMEDGIFSMLKRCPDLTTALAIMASMGAPVPAK